jgi:GTPase
MVLVSPSCNPVACWEFEGEILVLHHPTTISARYQAMGMNNRIGNIRLSRCVFVSGHANSHVAP